MIPTTVKEKHSLGIKLLIIAVNNNSDNDGIMDLDDPKVETYGPMGYGDPDLAWIQLDNPLYSSTLDSDVSGGITVYLPANIKAYLQRDKTGGALPASYYISMTQTRRKVCFWGKNAFFR